MNYERHYKGWRKEELGGGGSTVFVAGVSDGARRRRGKRERREKKGIKSYGRENKARVEKILIPVNAWS